jgi:lipopolysaccharide export LptBFGC system permease protein LptF
MRIPKIFKGTYGSGRIHRVNQMSQQMQRDEDRNDREYQSMLDNESPEETKYRKLKVQRKLNKRNLQAEIIFLVFAIIFSLMIVLMYTSGNRYDGAEWITMYTSVVVLFGLYIYQKGLVK